MFRRKVRTTSWKGEDQTTPYHSLRYTGVSFESNGAFLFFFSTGSEPRSQAESACLENTREIHPVSC